MYYECDVYNTRDLNNFKEYVIAIKTHTCVDSYKNL